MKYRLARTALLLSLCLLTGIASAAQPIAQNITVTLDYNSRARMLLPAGDADGDTLTYAITTPPLHGRVTLLGNINVAVYTPDANYSGTDHFTFVARDATHTSNTATVTINVADKTVAINDPILRACLQKQGAPQGLANLRSLTCNDQDLSTANLAELGNLPNLQNLDLGFSKLTSINGLAGLNKLRRLNLEFNDIGDLSALADMTQLEHLNLGFNRLTEISALDKLDKLRELHLDNNWITSLAPLNGKTRLTTLHLNNNWISDLTPLSGLSSLQTLGLNYNRITSLTVLHNLTNLRTLMLDGNTISDTSPLANLTELNALCLRGNQLTLLGPLSLLPDLHTLQAGFNQINDVSHLAGLLPLQTLGLAYNTIEDANVLSGLTNLRNLDLEQNRISDISELDSLDNLDGQLNLRGNQLLDINPLAGATGSFTLLADDNCLGSLSLPANITTFGGDWQFPAATCDRSGVNDPPVAYGQNITTYASTPAIIRLGGADPENSAITYRLLDAPANGALNRATGILSGNTLTYTPRSGYTGQDSFSFGVTDNGGLASTPASINITVREQPLLTDPALQACFAGNIPDNTTLAALNAFSCEGVNLASANLAELGKLTNLNSLTLRNANLTNITALAGLTGLSSLDLSNNRIMDISALERLSGLVWLNLGANNINDLSPLADLTRLLSLVLNDNNASNIAPLAGLTGLSSLHLEGNGLQTISALAGLRNLSILSLRSNRLQNTSLEPLTNLTASPMTLYVEGNCLTSTAMLPDNINVIGLNGNPPQRTVSNGSCPAP